MALQQHLADTGRNAEVTVNLERRMGIEEVRIGTTIGELAGLAVIRQQVQHVLDNREGVVTVEHTCPEVGLPAETPSRSHVATLVQGICSGGKEVGMAIRRNLVRGVKSIKVRDVTVLVLRVVTVDEPLLQLTVAAYLHGRQVGHLELEVGDVVGILAQRLSSLQGLAEHVESNLVVHRRTSRDVGVLATWAVLRRHRRY